MPDDADPTLTVALAEYEHLREAGRAIHDQSTARFNFFLAVASAATAVSAGLITTGGSRGPLRLAVLAGLGALVLLLGVAVFARQVELNDRGRRYAVAATALRTYLTRRLPELAPYVMMPTLDDPGPFAAEPFRRHWFRDAVGVAGTVGLVNSCLLATAAALAVATAGPPWLAILAAVGVFAGSGAGHLAIIRHRVSRSAGSVGAVLDRRSVLQPEGTVSAPDRVVGPAAQPTSATRSSSST